MAQLEDVKTFVSVVIDAVNEGLTELELTQEQIDTVSNESSFNEINEKLSFSGIGIEFDGENTLQLNYEDVEEDADGDDYDEDEDSGYDDGGSDSDYDGDEDYDTDDDSDDDDEEENHDGYDEDEDADGYDEEEDEDHDGYDPDEDDDSEDEPSKNGLEDGSEPY